MKQLTNEQIEFLKNYEINDNELEDMFEDYLNESYSNIEICGLSYTPSHALKNVDPVAFRVSMSDWLDYAINDCIIYELNNKYYSEDPYLLLEDTE